MSKDELIAFWYLESQRGGSTERAGIARVTDLLEEGFYAASLRIVFPVSSCVEGVAWECSVKDIPSLLPFPSLESLRAPAAWLFYGSDRGKKEQSTSANNLPLAVCGSYYRWRRLWVSSELILLWTYPQSLIPNTARRNMAVCYLLLCAWQCVLVPIRRLPLAQKASLFVFSI